MTQIFTIRQHHTSLGIPFCARSSDACSVTCSEALDRDGVLAGIGSFSADDIASLSQWTELGHAQTAPEPLPDPFTLATEVSAAALYHVTSINTSTCVMFTILCAAYLHHVEAVRSGCPAC